MESSTGTEVQHFVRIGKLTYYRLSEVANCQEKRHAYSKILKSKGVDFIRDFICSAQWTNGTRMDINDLPDLPCSNSHRKRKLLRKQHQVEKSSRPKQPNEKVVKVALSNSTWKMDRF